MKKLLSVLLFSVVISLTSFAQPDPGGTGDGSSAYGYVNNGSALRVYPIGQANKKVILHGIVKLDSIPILRANTVTLDFPSTLTATSSDLTINFYGAATGDAVLLGVPTASINANTSYTAWVSATNVVTVRFNNYSGGSVNPASGSFKVRIIK